MLVAVAMISCSDDSSVNIIDIGNGDDNGNGDEEVGTVYSITFNVEGGDTFTFSVDMDDATIEGDDLPDDFDGDVFEFDPENHKVFIAGGMVDWPQPGTEPGLELTTSGSTFGTAIPAGPTQFKFFIVPPDASNDDEENASWAYGEWEGDPNRSTEIEAGGDYFDNWGNQPEVEEPEPGDFPESLFVPGGYQSASGYGDDWTPADAPEIGSASPGEYSGYVYFAEGGMFKFKGDDDNDDWDPNWGGTDGTLEQNGADISIEEGGYYNLSVNLDELTYSATATTWAVIGDAANGWDDGDDVEMDFDADSKAWSVTLELSDEGEFKFRANEDWDFNIGLNEDEGVLVQDGENLSVNEAGSYTVSINLNGTEYTFEISQN